MKLLTKSLLLLSFALILLSANNNSNTKPKPIMPIDSVTQLITYTEVIKQAGTKDTLYNRAIRWINSFYKNASDVTKRRSPEEGIVEGVARFKVFRKDKDGNNVEPANIVSYTFTIAVREGRYKYTVTKFNLVTTSYFRCEKWLTSTDRSCYPDCDSFMQQIDDYAKNMTAKMKKGMQEVKKRDDNNW